MATYIALEGPDGVGKSTVAAALQAQLLRRVYVRHFPTEALAEEARKLTAEDYLLDMERWLEFRPGPILIPDAPPQASVDDTLYILDRWVLSTVVYAELRGEKIPQRCANTVEWLERVPLTTFVLMPKTPEALTDPDYPDPDGYDPEAVTAMYRRFLTDAFVKGRLSQYVPVVVDREEDTPQSTAEHIAEWVDVLQNTRYGLDDTAGPA